MLSAQVHQTPCDPVDCSPTGSYVPGILQARILKWVAISSSKGSSLPRNQTYISCIGRQIFHHCTTWEIPWIEEAGGYSPWGHKESGTTSQLNNSHHM